MPINNNINQANPTKNIFTPYEDDGNKSGSNTKATPSLVQSREFITEGKAGVMTRGGLRQTLINSTKIN